MSFPSTVPDGTGLADDSRTLDPDWNTFDDNPVLPARATDQALWKAILACLGRIERKLDQIFE